MMADTLDANSIPEGKRTPELKKALLDVLVKKTAAYNTTLEEDEKLLKSTLGSRQRMAIEVRLGEKRVLKKARERIRA
jgi:N-lysine methyltransferase SETD6